jgi:ElaB/YqjD/DUF883 family membrane-anchored ribosome-binding protein
MATKPLADPLAESDNTVRALDAANEVVELMRITHSVLHRAHNETYGEAHELAAKLSHSLHYMRKMAEVLRRAIEKQVCEQPETEVPRRTVAIHPQEYVRADGHP